MAPSIPARAARRVLDVRGRLVIPGMIDTHAHVYEHVTGSFGLNPDLVGVRAGVTTVVDQGGAGPLTLMGFRKFVAEPAKTRVLAFVSNYLVGGLVGHRYTGLYGPHGIDVRETVRAIEGNRDLVRGISQPGHRFVSILLGLVSIAAGIIVLGDPDIGLHTLAILAGIMLIIRGTVEMALGWELHRVHRA